MKDKAKEKTKKSAEKKKADKKKADKKHKNDLKDQKPSKSSGDQKSGKKKKEKKVRLPDDEKISAGTRRKIREKSLQERALIYRALGDESRLQILDILQEQELCAADLLKLVPIVQSTLSHHMKILCESGLVICRRQARWSYYTVNKQLFRETAERLERWSE